VKGDSRRTWIGILILWAFCAAGTAAAGARPNIVFILSDDHRYNFMGFLKTPPFLETPTLDSLKQRGVYFRNTFVSTSLCSPSRATILTGKYMHHHRVVDNQRPVPPGTVFFPQYLRKAGYETAFIGKWHMGHEKDDPRPGFDYWASFKGQGTYFDPVLNVNGVRKKFRGYTGDVLADLALNFLRKKRNRPFFLYLSFKAVHFPFRPPNRHLGRYERAEVPYPETMANTEENYRTQPRWVRERRYSIHGIDHMETGRFDNDPVPSFEDFYRRYCEAVHGLDENIGKVVRFLDSSGLSRKTVLFYTSDNGFELGEHGFYDKRDAFEESIRIPLLVYAPGFAPSGLEVDAMIQNIDFAPTILELAGVPAPPEAAMDGRSFVPLLQGKKVPWRKEIFYEYYWEWNFPATPTMFALRTERYKYIYYHGVWDIDGLYDLQADPHERHNLIEVPAFRPLALKLRKRLFDFLEASGGLYIPVRRPKGERLDARKLRR